MELFKYLNRAVVSAIVAVLAMVANATGLPDIADEAQGHIVEWVLTVVAGVGALVAAFSQAPKADDKPQT